jgi:hypothetical protein
MQPEPEALVQRAKSRPLGIAIEAEVSLADRSGTLDSPSQERRRNALTGICTAHRESMHERGIMAVKVGPEQSILELKAYCADDVAVDFSDDEESLSNLGPDAMLVELAFHPHRRPVQLLHPVRRFDQRLDERSRVISRRLANQRLPVDARCAMMLAGCRPWHQITNAMANPS